MQRLVFIDDNQQLVVRSLVGEIEANAPAGKEYFVIEEGNLPDRKYRNAWVLIDGTVTIDPELAEQIDDAEFKTNRAAAVRAIKVTVNGMEFDGDEDAQSRMSLAILAAKTLGSPLIPLWKLADNSTAFDIPVADLEMALALSVVAMAEVWV